MARWDACRAFVENARIESRSGAACMAAVETRHPAGRSGPVNPAAASSAGAFFILALGDKTQFVTGAIAAGSGHPVLAAVGAAAGITIANAPAVVLGERWPMLVPLRAIRIGAGIVLALAGLYLVIGALGLS